MRDEAWFDRLVLLARDTMSTTPGWDPARYDDETLRQTMCAFMGLLHEDLDGPGDGQAGASWRLFMEATIPAYVAAGQSAGSIVGATTTFLVLLTAELGNSVPAAKRHDVVMWLATFAGRYVSDVCEAAAGAST